MMAMALQLYEDDTCDGCGQPRHISQQDGMVGAYEIHDQIVCHGCAAMDEHKAQAEKKEALPGQKIRLTVRT